MRTDHYPGPCRTDALLVLLPPAQAQLADFVTHGFVAALRERALAIDLVLAEVTYHHVMANTAAQALHEHVVRPAQAKGYRQIWLAGISMGAFNALHYAAAHACHLAGVQLIAPYPGTADVLAEITSAGGARQWAASATTPTGDERDWWRWLCQQVSGAQWSPPVYFGTGESDRFVRGQRMLADLLPASNVHYAPGGHDWPTWLRLWQTWLDHGLLAQLTQPLGTQG